MPIECSSCRASVNPVFIKLMHSVDLGGLIGLLNGDMRHSPCPRCARPLDSPPSIAIQTRADRSHLLWTLASGELSDEQQGAAVNKSIELHTDYDSLVAGVLADVRRSARLVAVGRRTIDDGWEWMDRHWNELDGWTMAAACAWPRVEGADPEFRVSDGDIVWMQVGALVRLAVHVLHTPGATLSTDGGQFLMPGAVQSGSVSMLDDAFGDPIRERIEDPDLFTDLFLRHCLLAAASFSAGEPNPRRDVWTQLLIGHWTSAAYDKLREPRERLLPDTEVLRASVSRDVVWRLLDANLDMLSDPAVTAALERLGLPDVQINVLRRQRVDLSDASPDDLARWFAATSAQPNFNLGILNNWLTVALASAVDSGRADLVVPLRDLALSHAAGMSAQGRARVNARFGDACIRAGLTATFLGAVGRTPKEWERDAAPRAAAELMSARSSALRIEGDFAGSLAMAEAALALVPDDSDLYLTLAMNVALGSRSAGAPDRAVAILRLLAQGTGHDAAEIAAALADAEVAAGNLDEALRVALDALEETSLAEPEIDGQLRLTATSVLLAGGELHRAREILDARRGPTGMQHFLARLELEARSAGSDGADAPELVALFAEAERHIADSDRAGNVLIGLQLRRTRLAMLDLLKSPKASAARADLHAYEREHRAISYQSILTVAAERYEAGDPAAARAALGDFPIAAAKLIGSVHDVGAIIGAHSFLEAPMRRLALALYQLEPPSWEMRAMAELSRNVIARTQAPGQADTAWFENVAADATLSALAQAEYPVAVLEWLPLDVPLITVIRPDGASSSYEFDGPNVSLRDLAEVLRQRLDCWTRSASSPFDLADWSEVERWLRAAVRTALTTALERPVTRELAARTHLVVFDSRDHQGLPWHAADVPFTVSYAAGWEDLLQLLDEPRAPAHGSLGAAFVHAHDDSPVIIAAFKASAAAVRSLAGDLGLPVSVLEGDSADVEAVLALLEQVDICTIVCHGIADRDRYDVAWLLAENGRLPSRLPQWLSGADDAGSRLAWRDLNGLSRAPRLIASAACSSGLGFRGGYGDHIGLYSAARRLGTKTLVAPYWDASASRAVHVLAACLRHHLGGRSLAWALRAAVEEQPQDRQGWRAKTLAITGDWR